MGWMQRLFARVRQDPAQLVRHVYVPMEFGVRLTEDQALSVSAVWACVDVIAKAIASCRWNIFQPLPGGRRDLLEEDPTAWVLNTRPNPEMTAIAFREALLYNAIPHGNAYAEIVPNAAGRLAELWPLEHDRVTPRRDPQSGVMFYEYVQPDGQVVRLDARRVFHLRGPSLSGLLGESIVARAIRSIASAAAAERYAGAFFGQGAHAAGVLRHPRALSDEKYERLRSSWGEKQQGLKNLGKPIILEEGMEYTQTSVDPQKAQMVESRQFSVEEICRWFGVPPHKIQHLLRATFSNIEHLSIEFVRDALTPWCRRLEQEADFKLFRQDRGPWRYTCIDTAPLTYGDAKSRADADAIWRQNGIKTANEIRAREGLNDVGDEGDVLLVQSNLTTVERLLNPPAPAPVAPRAATPAPEDDVAEDLDDGAAVARQALGFIVADVVNRYLRRLSNRRRDLSRQHEGDALLAHMEEERATQRPKVVADLLAAAMAFAPRALGRRITHDELEQLVRVVEAGEVPPAEAVGKLFLSA